MLAPSTGFPNVYLEPGQEVGNFRIERALGSGAMADVFLATQLSMDRPVALKVAPPNTEDDAEVRQLFSNEVRMTAKFEHPSIVPAYESGEEDGLVYLAMRYIRGKDLAHHLHKLGTFPETDVLTIAATVSAALAYASRPSVL